MEPLSQLKLDSDLSIKIQNAETTTELLKEKCQNSIGKLGKALIPEISKYTNYRASLLQQLEFLHSELEIPNTIILTGKQANVILNSALLTSHLIDDNNMQMNFVYVVKHAEGKRDISMEILMVEVEEQSDNRQIESSCQDVTELNQCLQEFVEQMAESNSMGHYQITLSINCPSLHNLMILIIPDIQTIDVNAYYKYLKRCVAFVHAVDTKSCDNFGNVEINVWAIYRLITSAIQFQIEARSTRNIQDQGRGHPLVMPIIIGFNYSKFIFVVTTPVDKMEDYKNNLYGQQGIVHKVFGKEVTNFEDTDCQIKLITDSSFLDHIVDLLAKINEMVKDSLEELLRNNGTKLREMLHNCNEVTLCWLQDLRGPRQEDERKLREFRKMCELRVKEFQTEINTEFSKIARNLGSHLNRKCDVICSDLTSKNIPTGDDVLTFDELKQKLTDFINLALYQELNQWATTSNAFAHLRELLIKYKGDIFRELMNKAKSIGSVAVTFPDANWNIDLITQSPMDNMMVCIPSKGLNKFDRAALVALAPLWVPLAAAASLIVLPIIASRIASSKRENTELVDKYKSDESSRLPIARDLMKTLIKEIHNDEKNIKKFFLDNIERHFMEHLNEFKSFSKTNCLMLKDRDNFQDEKVWSQELISKLQSQLTTLNAELQEDLHSVAITELMYCSNENKFMDEQTILNRYGIDVCSNDVFKQLTILGTGAYSTVYGFDRDGRSYAMKVIEVLKFDAASLRRINRELSILPKLRHPNIAEWVANVHFNSDQYKMRIGIISVKYSSNLRDFRYAHKQMCTPFNSENHNEVFRYLVKEICAPVMRGLNYLHKMEYIHRDLKLENILVDRIGSSDGLDIRITDFGFSKLIVPGEEKYSTFCIGTKSYIADECWRGTYNKSTDVYAAGVMLWELYFGLDVYKNENQFFSYTAKDTHFQKLISEMTSSKSEDRPVASRCLFVLGTLVGIQSAQEE